MEVKQRVLRHWVTSLDPLGHAKLECAYPLSPAEREHVLEWLELIRRQINRDDFVETQGETGKDSQ